jgi:Dolichyl-phosphate-mannose-protein mannosyltransferase
MRVAARVIVALLIGIGVARIISTYPVFNHTIDEGAHLACGMQWFEGIYTYDPKHTPVARVAIALLPYLDGLRSYNDPSFWREGVALLSNGGRYWHNLTLARLGILPFFVLATVVVFLWSRQLYGVGAALLAAAIFTLQPVVLAHSGLATTDIALTAIFLIAVYAFTRWLSSPSWRTALGLGVANGLAIATKLSTLAFLPATILGILPLYLLSRGAGAGNWRLKPLLGQAAIVILGMTMVIWGCYRFSHASIDQFSSAPARLADRAFGAESSTAREVHALTATLQLPAPELYNGLRDLRDVNREHVRSYLLGRIRPGGWWYFYPVALAVKTPLAVLLLAAIGAASLLMGWWRVRAEWQRLVPLVSAIAIVAVAAPSRLDIGVRHVMPVFAFLSMLAAVGAVALWNWRPTPRTDRPAAAPISKAGPIALSALLLWLIGSSAYAHPDYLAYFNELAGRNPANVLVISDLDWGQDLGRLSVYLREQRVTHLSIAYENFFDGPALGLPENVRLACGETATGWVAVEERRARVYPECFQWLAARPVKAYVGKSMRIYYLPETVSTR